MKKILGVLLLLIAGSACALSSPSSSRFDSRIRHVTYNSQDVVQIDAVLGIATHIVLDPDENYVTHVFGDSAAYAFTRNGNNYFIKPAAEKANTNLIIVTDQRSYNFRLTFRNDRNHAVYQVAFRYPEKEQRLEEERLNQLNLEEAYRSRHGGFNLAYSMSGDTDIAPVNVWDDGVMTYFKFPSGMDLPNIKMMDADGQELIVNRNSEANNIIRVHGISGKWIIRLGNRALAVWNDGYNPRENGVNNQSGTTSPEVQRVIRGQ